MNPKRIVDPDKIDILSIRTLAGSIECTSQANARKVHTYDFGFELSSAIEVERRLIGLKLKVDIEGLDVKQKRLAITGTYTHEIIFFIENLEDFIDIAVNEHEASVDMALGSTLVGIMYSTVRGLIYARTQGTSLGVVTLPVVAPMKLMETETGITGRVKNSGSKKQTARKKAKN